MLLCVKETVIKGGIGLSKRHGPMIKRNHVKMKSAGNDINHTVFQTDPSSPNISINDVTDALEKTKNMLPHQRLSYFQQKGIHYSRSIRYIATVEKLEKSFQEDDQLVSIDEYDIPGASQSKNISDEQIAKFIEEAMREMQHNVMEEKPSIELKKNNNLEDIGKHVLSIGLVFLCLLLVRYALLAM
jgi:hypothetical protein